MVEKNFEIILTFSYCMKEKSSAFLEEASFSFKFLFELLISNTTRWPPRDHYQMLNIFQKQLEKLRQAVSLQLNRKKGICLVISPV